MICVTLSLPERHPRAYSSHQPELDTAKAKDTYNSWETTQRVAYLDPKIRQQRIVPNQEQLELRNTDLNAHVAELHKPKGTLD